MSFIMLRGCWSDIVLNVHATAEDKSDDKKGSFCRELECVFDELLKYHMKILLDFKQKWGENIFSNQQPGMRVYMKLVMIIGLV
jgi:hypothetical protein